jgi:NAD(P)-dependent dehydrogenase (short-subunit alcohol dehydrogenase family)
MSKRVVYDYSDASALITGGSNGIGLAIARAYQEAGASVVITGRKATAGDYDHDLSDFIYRQLDVNSQDALVELAEGLDKLDILINNAGGAQADEWGHAGFDQSLNVNLASAFHLSSACKPLLEASEFEGGASIIGIASMTSFFGYEWTPGYGAAKAGLVQLVKTLGISWGPNGIRANAVAAGITRTNLTAPAIDGMPEMIEGMLARQGLKRVGEAEDIAAAVLFLTSPAASWITGQTLSVDGGFSTGMN